MNVNGKKVFLDTENAVTIYRKLTRFFSDVSILESVIGGENKGRYSIILFNIYENVEIFKDFALINNKKNKIKSPSDFIKKFILRKKLKTFIKRIFQFLLLLEIYHLIYVNLHYQSLNT